MQKIKLPSNEVILLALAAAGALTFTWAFLVMDGANLLTLAGWLLALRGIVLGGAAGLAMAKISHALPRANKTNKPYLQGAFVAFLAVTPVIISPVTFATMSPEMMTLPSGLRWCVAVAAGVFVDALTAGVAFASGKLEADDKPLEAKPSEQKPAKKPLEPATSETQPATSQIEPALFCSVAGCSGNKKSKDGSFSSQAALNAHMSKHKAK